MIANTDSSWRYHSRVLAAMIYASDLNDYQAAREVLAPVLEERNLPFSLIQSARALDQVYREKMSMTQTAPDTASTTTEEPQG